MKFQYDISFSLCCTIGRMEFCYHFITGVFLAIAICVYGTWLYDIGPPRIEILPNTTPSLPTTVIEMNTTSLAAITPTNTLATTLNINTTNQPPNENSSASISAPTVASNQTLVSINSTSAASTLSKNETNANDSMSSTTARSSTINSNATTSASNPARGAYAL